MRAVITVVGRDTVGIIADISAYCASKSINIIDISQSVMSDFFCMIMLVDISKNSEDFWVTVDALSELGRKKSLSIHTMHEDIFNSMHTI